MITGLFFGQQPTGLIPPFPGLVSQRRSCWLISLGIFDYLRVWGRAIRLLVLPLPPFPPLYQSSRRIIPSHIHRSFGLIRGSKVTEMRMTPPYRGYRLGPITLVRGRYLKIQTYGSHRNCFYVKLTFGTWSMLWSLPLNGPSARR
jgi:hypothetical protein